MTTEQLKLAVKAQTLLEVFEHSDVGTQLLRQAKECIDKLIEADKQNSYITVGQGFRGNEINSCSTETNRKIDWVYNTATNDKVTL